MTQKPRRLDGNNVGPTRGGARVGRSSSLGTRASPRRLESTNPRQKHGSGDLRPSVHEAEARATWQVKPEHVFQSGSGLGHSGDLARRRSYSCFSTAGGLRGARRQRGGSMGEGKAVR